MGVDKVRVAVRVRPFNNKEKNTENIIEVKGNQIILLPPNANSNNNNNNNTKKPFTFDNVFDLDSEQEEVFEKIGHDLLANAFEGYNACCLAYGQTGSGKTFTMLGSKDFTPETRGVIPRICDKIFHKIEVNEDPNNQFKVEVSYMEIYNEKVRDLLLPKRNTLKVREHSILGPYVDGLSMLAVKSPHDVFTLMDSGNKSRTVAATNMNSESSRSHAVFTLILTNTITDQNVIGEKVSRISLVDLAGSERAIKSGAVGERLKEGSNINKSLTTLGLVISKLADGRESFVPYRDSVLTWLLKDNLGGNSKTTMIATVSPSNDHYEESLSTLRYADRAKRIVNNAVVNEDPNAKLIRELQAEVKELRELLKLSKGETGPITEQLSLNEKLMRQASETWEEKLQRSEQATVERQAALEKMGISVQQSGISVEKNRFYLVNLNADPSLNELLVYYLKERTIVGRPDSLPPADIQLTGLGIELLHAELILEPDNSLYIIPYPNAKTHVNGEKLEKRQILNNGDRILWGNHHFFRLNSPIKANNNNNTTTTNGSEITTYEQATEELWKKQMIVDPIHEAVAKLEFKHQQDKAVALEKQRQDLERQFSALMHVISPMSPPSSLLPWEKEKPSKSNKIADGLKLLKDYLLNANGMVREANEIASALNVNVKYSVMLLIPPSNLTPARNKNGLVTEPSIRVEKPGHNHQVWSMEKLQNRLVDMRDCYEDQAQNSDLFFEPDQPHILLGIANIFLQALFYDDVTLKYPVPVINQQGEIRGRLLVEIAKISGSMSEGEDITVKVTIRHLAGVNSLHYVFCQYVFCENTVVIRPGNVTSVVRFDHTRYFTLNVSEEFIDYCQEGALSVEVWGLREGQTGIPENNLPDSNSNVTDRWKEVTSGVKFWVEIQELNENGEYAHVEVDTSTNSGTGGVYNLRQGLQRRILISVETSGTNVGQLPIVCDEIDQVSIGAITPRSTSLQRPLDSYQEEDLAVLRRRWGEALKRRREYLDMHLQNLAKKSDKSEEEIIREKSLVSQWLLLTEERNAVLVPEPDSGVPGAPTMHEKNEIGMELHMPIIFLDISEDLLNAPPTNSTLTAGLNTLLPKEHEAEFVPLPMLRKSYGDFYSTWSDQRMSTESWCLVSWDSSVHEFIGVSGLLCPQLNKPTPLGEVIYLIIRISLRLSHPVHIDCVLRKRICVTVRRNRPSFAERLRARFKKNEELKTCKRTGVIYQIVSHLPKSSEQLETREELANLAVSQGEVYIEEYLRAISTVDSILNLDRMRQTVYLREEQSKVRPKSSNETHIRKTLSVPNISQLFTLSKPEQPSRNDKMRPVRSESLANLSKMQARPSSLQIDPNNSSQPHQNTCPQTNTKWTSIMTTVEEEELKNSDDITG